RASAVIARRVLGRETHRQAGDPYHRGRFRARRGAGRRRTDLRSILHNEGTREGHGTRSRDRVAHRGESSGDGVGRARARRWRGVPSVVPGGVMKILVIDDELGLRHTLSLILTAEGHAVEVVCDGRAGLEAAAKGSPDLILCDVRMPEMDGFAF